MAPAIKTSPASESSSPADSNTSMPAPPPPMPVKQRKKPGPKPKPKPMPVKLTLIVKLRIDSTRLAAVVPVSTSETASTDTPAASSPNGTTPRQSPAASDTAAAASGQKRRGVPGPKPGQKRTRAPAALLGGKPGRKKAKLDLPPGLANGAHVVKLGPKANAGVINEKLRALDRTGRPSKRWTKTGFTLKSFTGVQWTVPSWSKPAVSSALSVNGISIATPENVSAEPSIAATPPDMQMHLDSGNLNQNIPTFGMPSEIAV